jgi:hypothetical protein
VSTIAYANGLMAADSGIFINDCVLQDATKIHRIWNGGIVGIVGDLEQSAAFAAWLKAGCKGRKPRTNTLDAILVEPSGKIWLYQGGNRAHPMKETYHAIGAGDDLARGAMFAGADARTAIRAAMKHNAFTRGRIRTLSL